MQTIQERLDKQLNVLFIKNLLAPSEPVILIQEGLLQTNNRHERYASTNMLSESFHEEPVDVEQIESIDIVPTLPTNPPKRKSLMLLDKVIIDKNTHNNKAINNSATRKQTRPKHASHKSETIKTKLQINSTTQLPLSLRLQLLEETLPIIQAISHRYQKELGVQNSTAIANQLYTEEIARRIEGLKGWEDLCNDVSVEVDSDDDEYVAPSFVANIGRRMSQIVGMPRESFSGSFSGSKKQSIVSTNASVSASVSVSMSGSGSNSGKR